MSRLSFQTIGAAALRKVGYGLKLIWAPFRYLKWKLVVVVEWKLSYQSALNLHRTLNFEEPNYEAITVLDQLAFTPRQMLFKIFRNNSTKIGMNTSSNKFYQLTDRVMLSILALNFIHFKKLMKIQFLKYGKT